MASRQPPAHCSTAVGRWSPELRWPPLMTSFINDPEHWRVRAEEIRALSDEEQDDVSKQMMLRIAADLSKVHFELLAREGELRNTESLAASYRRRAQTCLDFALTLLIGEKRTLLIDTAQTLLRLAEEQEALTARGAAKESQAPMQQQQQVQPKIYEDKKE